MKQAAGNALLQAFMPKEEYDALRDEDRAVRKLARPLLMTAVAFIWTGIVIAYFLMADIVFAVTGHDWPFCQKQGLTSLPFMPPANQSSLHIDGDSRASYLLTEDEAAQFFWIVIFLPTSIVLAPAVLYLLAGIAVAYTAPARHPSLMVVDNNCCASRHGGVRCLAILNISFFVVFALMAFLGSIILTLETDCSVALFWCYEAVCWGIAFLLAGTAGFLRRKAAVIMDVGDHYGSRTLGVEMLEAQPVEPDHVIQKRLAEGFRAWSGVLESSDDEESEAAQPLHAGLDDIWEEDDSKETYDVDIMRNRIG